jgi:hypothetical protein
MAMTREELTAAALQVSPPLRAELVERLVESLYEEDEVHPDWLAELVRRDAD